MKVYLSQCLLKYLRDQNGILFEGTVFLRISNWSKKRIKSFVRFLSQCRLNLFAEDEILVLKKLVGTETKYFWLTKILYTFIFLFNKIVLLLLNFLKQFYDLNVDKID